MDWGASTLQANPTSAPITPSVIPLHQACMARDDMARDDMARAGSKASVACNKTSLLFTIKQDSLMYSQDSLLYGLLN